MTTYTVETSRQALKFNAAHMASFADGVFDEVTADLGDDETTGLARLLYGEWPPT